MTTQQSAQPFQGAGMTGSTRRRVLITGGGSGFGLHIAQRLCENGDAVAIFDIDPDRVESVSKELGTPGHVVDVRSRSQVRAAVFECARELGGLDALVISAGVFQMGPLDDVTEEEWDRVIDVNLKGAFLTAQAAAPELRASGRGRIVMIGSDVGKRGFATQSAYAASKFGLNGLAESLAAELAADNVTVNTVCPVGCPTTGMGREVLAHKIAVNNRTPQEVMAAAAATNPLGRNATENDITNAVLFFLSDAADFLTGIALDVDGGAHLGTVPGLKS
jgi:NAD(P)-dependent dehydrogenase (short-subunit alcohol dehydrogenase family)